MKHYSFALAISGRAFLRVYSEGAWGYTAKKALLDIRDCFLTETGLIASDMDLILCSEVWEKIPPVDRYWKKGIHLELSDFRVAIQWEVVE